MRSRVVVLGEVLCDLFSNRAGAPLATTNSLVPRLGGAPANVAVQLARLGVDVAMISAVGRDPLGERMMAALKREGVETSAIKVDRTRRTGLTLVEVARDGGRRFFPFRANSADLALTRADLDEVLLRTCALLHTGTVSLRSPSARAATRRAIAIARGAGALISLDVNLRWGMYPTRELLLNLARRASKRAHIIKATRDEALALFDAPARTSNDALADRLLSCGAKLAFVTLDEKGALLASRVARVLVKSPKVRAVDATGAGDAFVGAAIARLLTMHVDVDRLDRSALLDIGAQACAAGASTVRVLGATAGMPRRFI